MLIPALLPNGISTREFTMSRFRYFFYLGSSVLLLFGWQQSKQSAPVKSTPKDTIQIEQIKETQIVLEKLGQRAWV